MSSAASDQSSDTEESHQSKFSKTLNQRFPNTSKKEAKHPDYRVTTKGNIEIGAGWIKTGSDSGKDYISLSLASPEFGAKKIYCNLGKAAGQDDEDVFAMIWNPID